MSKYLLFEPENLSPFGPLTLLRSVGELRFGVYSNIERAQLILDNKKLSLWVRPILADEHAEKYPDMKINQEASAETIFLNAAVPAWTYPAAIDRLRTARTAVFGKDGQIIAARPGYAINFLPGFHRQLDKLEPVLFDSEYRNHAPNWIWDYLDLIHPALEHDIKLWVERNNYLTKMPAKLFTLSDRNIFIHNTAQVGKFVHLDASNGPVIIDEDVKISPFSSIIGPVYLGKRSSTKPSTALRQCVVGRVCNLGGEVKSSIIHPYSNKSHDGFLGDSILGSWINLGAGTITSNLKNNYQKIRVSWDGNNYESGRQFLGSIMGDHTKTAIGVRLNTGTIIGPFCNVFQADFPPRAIPSFSWGNGTHDLEKALATADLMMQRRGLSLSEKHQAVIRALAVDHSPFTHF